MIHPSADVSGEAKVGPDTRVWEFVRIREGAVLGDGCIIGRGAYIDAGVIIGDRVKIQNNALIYGGARVESDAFIGPGAIITNDRSPRSTTMEGRLAGRADWTLDETHLEQGCSIGAGAVVVAGCDIGRFAMVGAGAVVTRPVPAHGLAAGNPARLIGWTCRCGRRLAGDDGEPVDASHSGSARCPLDGTRFTIYSGRCTEEPND